MRQDILAGIAMGLALVPGLILIPSMLSRTGMDFAGAYTACVLLSIIGTLLWALACRMPFVLAPHVSVVSWLSYAVIISRGYSWQAALGASFLASLICAIMTFVFRSAEWKDFIPEHLGRAMPMCLGLMLVLLGLRQGHVIVPAATGYFSIGDLADPVVFHSLMGILVTAVLLVCRIPGAMLWGILLVAAVSLVEGFWAFPAAPFLEPELEKTALQLDVAGALEMPGTVLSLSILSLLLVQGTGLGLGKPVDKSSARLVFGVNAFGSLLAAFPMAPAIESAVGVGTGNCSRTASLAAAGVLGILFFCEPLLSALASYGAVTAPAIVLSGCLIIKQTELSHGSELSIFLSTCIMAVLMPVTQSISVGLGAGLVTYVFLSLWEGRWRQLQAGTWSMAGMFLMLFVLEAF